LRARGARAGSGCGGGGERGGGARARGGVAALLTARGGGQAPHDPAMKRLQGVATLALPAAVGALRAGPPGAPPLPSAPNARQWHRSALEPDGCRPRPAARANDNDGSLRALGAAELKKKEAEGKLKQKKAFSKLFSTQEPTSAARRKAPSDEDEDEEEEEEGSVHQDSDDEMWCHWCGRRIERGSEEYGKCIRDPTGHFLFCSDHRQHCPRGEDDKDESVVAECAPPLSQSWTPSHSDSSSDDEHAGGVDPARRGAKHSGAEPATVGRPVGGGDGSEREIQVQPRALPQGFRAPASSAGPPAPAQAGGVGGAAAGTSAVAAAIARDSRCVTSRATLPPY
jgi:hypothetical protein